MEMNLNEELEKKRLDNNRLNRRILKLKKDLEEITLKNESLMAQMFNVSMSNNINSE